MTTPNLTRALAARRALLGLRPEQIADHASIQVMDVGRIERGDEDVRLDLVIGYAAALGCAITLRGADADVAPSAPCPQAAATVAADLGRLRAEFAACREGIDLSPTALARYSNLTAKTVFALERGPQIPKLSTAVAHAARFGLSLSLCGRDDRMPARTIREVVAADMARIYERIGSTTKSTSSHHMKAPRSEMEGAVAQVLSTAYVALGVPARAFAQSIAVDWKTIVPEGVPSFTGRFCTTAKVASRLGFRILVLPASVDLASIVGGRGAAPVDEPDLSDAQACAAAGVFAARRRELGLGYADVHRLGGGSASTTRNIETNPNNATLAFLCQYAAILGLTVAAVPEAAVPDALAACRTSKPAVPRAPLPENGAVRHFNPDVDARKRRIMAELCGAVASAGPKAPRDQDAASVLGLPVRAVEGLATGRRYRARMVEFAGLLRAAGVILVFEDVPRGFRAEFGTKPSAEGEIAAFFAGAVVHRQGLGLSHGAAGLKVGISGSRFQHIEEGDPKTLTTSLILYAEALGLSWRIEALPASARAGAVEKTLQPTS